MQLRATIERTVGSVLQAMRACHAFPKVVPLVIDIQQTHPVNQTGEIRSIPRSSSAKNQ